MKSALIIFNGLKFPYYVVEYALAQIKQQNASLHNLFLKATKEISENYGFPSDLQVAEEITNREDAQKDDMNIINDHIKLVTDMARSEGVACTNKMITDCSLHEVLKLLNSFDSVYIDAGFDSESTSMLANNKFKLSELIARATVPVIVVAEDRSVS